MENILDEQQIRLLARGWEQQTIIVSKECVGDPRISFNTKGIFLFLLGRFVDDIDELNEPDAINELRRHGYLFKHKIRYKQFEVYSRGFIYDPPVQNIKGPQCYLKKRSGKPLTIKKKKNKGVLIYTLQRYPKILIVKDKPIVFRNNRKTCGVYMILNRVNYRIYIGKSVHIESRYRSHVRDLFKNSHTNTNLQNDFNLYGAKNFEFEVIVECEEEYLSWWESYVAYELMVFNPQFGYNTGYLPDVRKKEEGTV